MDMKHEPLSSLNCVLHWYALYVRSKRERAVETALRDKGFETYLPMIRETRMYSSKKRTAEVPCFPNYLFCKIDPADRLPVMITPDLYSIVGNGHSPVSIPDSEIQALKAMINSRYSLERHSHLSAGERVLISAGPLAGVEGVLLRTGNSPRVAVSISLLCRSISAEVDTCNIIRVAAAPPVIYRAGAA
jgi:transcription antitermination factor NusG